MGETEQREQAEIDFYKVSPSEKPGAESLGNLLNKMTDADVFRDMVSLFDRAFAGFSRVVELGGGQGWASCLIKKKYPHLNVTATDISPFAVQSTPLWERIYNVKLDNSYACPSQKTHESDGTVDCVFTFASAHHFPRHQETMKEISRILKPGGQAFYFHEPTCIRLLYPLARWRVNRKRPIMKEDVLVFSHIKKLATAAGLTAEIQYHPTIKKRGKFETIYYLLLNFVPFLARFLPCTANIVFKKLL
jgi:SAM-dependent methyltransferase